MLHDKDPVEHGDGRHPTFAASDLFRRQYNLSLQIKII
jgi:hypothetical protein